MPADSRPAVNPYRDFERRLRALEAAYVRPETRDSAYDMAPRGRLNPRFVSTADSAVFSATGDSEMTTGAITLTAGRRYQAHLFIPQVDYVAGGLGVNSIWTVNLKVNGSVHRRIATYSHGLNSQTIRYPLEAHITYEPASTGSYTFLISLVETADGATLQFIGAATADRERVLEVYDVGGVIV